jgi:hypothetical protein
MSQFDSGYADVTPEQAVYAEQRVRELMAPLRARDLDGTLAPYLDWLGDDVVAVYKNAILNDTWSQLETQLTNRFNWVAEQLTTPRRCAVFGQLLINTGEGDVWGWLTRWDGIRPMDVGEDPNVVNAWDSGVFDPTAPATDEAGQGSIDGGYSQYDEQAPAAVVYTQYHSEGATDPAYTEYRNED